MTLNSPEIATGRVEAIRRQFISIVASDEAQRLSEEYLKTQPKAMQATARTTQSLFIPKNGYFFVFQHYIGEPGYEDTRRDSFSMSLLKDGKITDETINIILFERMNRRDPILEPKGKQESKGKTKDLSFEETLDKAEEVLESYSPAKPN